MFTQICSEVRIKIINFEMYRCTELPCTSLLLLFISARLMREHRQGQALECREDSLERGASSICRCLWWWDRDVFLQWNFWQNSCPWGLSSRSAGFNKVEYKFVQISCQNTEFSTDSDFMSNRRTLGMQSSKASAYWLLCITKSWRQVHGWSYFMH